MISALLRGGFALVAVVGYLFSQQVDRIFGAEAEDPTGGHLSLAVGGGGLVLVLGGSAYAAATLAPDSVGTREIANHAVHSEDLARGAVTTMKIAPNAVTPSRIAPSAVNSDDVENGSLMQEDFHRGQVPPRASASVRLRRPSPPNRGCAGPWRQAPRSRRY